MIDLPAIISKRSKKRRPITVVTVLLDLDDRIKALEKKHGIKNKPFKLRVRKWL